MESTLPAVLFGLLGLGVVLWLVSAHLLFGRLAARHPEAYASLGQPHLVRNNTPRHSVALLRFVAGREYRKLRDPDIQRIGFLMLAILVVNVLLFASLCGIIIVGTSTRPA